MNFKITRSSTSSTSKNREVKRQYVNPLFMRLKQPLRHGPHIFAITDEGRTSEIEATKLIFLFIATRLPVHG